MNETILKYGIEGFNQILVMISMANLLLVIFTAWIFLKGKEIRTWKNIWVHLLSAFFWSILYVVHNKFISETDILLTIAGIVKFSYALLITTLLALVFNTLFRIRIFNRKKK